MKQFKIVLSHILDTAVHKPKFVDLLTYVGSAVRIVNERPLVLLSGDPRDFTAYRCDGYAIVFTSNLNSFHVHVLTYIVLPSSFFLSTAVKFISMYADLGKNKIKLIDHSSFIFDPLLRPTCSSWTTA